MKFLPSLEEMTGTQRRQLSHPGMGWKVGNRQGGFLEEGIPEVGPRRWVVFSQEKRRKGEGRLV